MMIPAGPGRTVPDKNLHCYLGPPAGRALLSPTVTVTCGSDWQLDCCMVTVSSHEAPL